MKVAFRADASYEIGSGHVMRCFTLAQILIKKGIDVIFICRDFHGDLSDFLRDNNFKVFLLPEPKHDYKLLDNGVPYAKWLGVDWKCDSKETSDVLQIEAKVDCIVIDHYGIDEKWENVVRDYVSQIVIIDDLADRNHDCDILIDQNFYHGLASRYKKLVPEDCITFLGPKYTLLRSEFINARDNLQRDKSNIERVFVFFGGMDSSNETYSVLKLLENWLTSYDYIFDVDVVVSNSNVHSEKIEKICKDVSSFNFHKQVNNISQLMVNANLAIGAGGTTAFERIFVLLPALVKVIADNQKTALGDLEDIGAVKLYQNDSELNNKLKDIFEKGVNDIPDIVNIGTNYIAGIIDKRIKLKSPISFDVRRSYLWLQDDNLRDDFLMSKKPSLKQHFIYWRNMLLSDTDYLKAIYFLDKHVGFCGIKEINKKNCIGEAWIYLGTKNMQCAGVGTAALSQLIYQFRTKFLSVKKLILHVNNCNLNAINAYKKLGFIKTNISENSIWFSQKNNMTKMELIL